MLRRSRSLAGAVVVALTGTVLAACAGRETIMFINNSVDDVTVQYGQESFKVEGNGGLGWHADECVIGPIVVTYLDARSTTIDGNLCPGSKLVITAHTARISEPPKAAQRNVEAAA